MGYNNSAIQILQQAEDLKIRVLAKNDLLNNSQSWTDQQKLQRVYHRALILDLEYALDKKVEQDLWNIGFKNHINILQELTRDKKNPSRSDCQALLNWCLESASGFYISLLQEFCNSFDIDLPFRRHGKVFGIAKESYTNDQLNLPQSSSCLYICQYCLVHLGDIARYRNQRKQAENFYKQAIQVSPNSGHPYNQLALLEASLGDKLSTVFYYVRGIAVKNPFPAATTNLLSTLSSIIDKERPAEKLLNKMTSNEFIHQFLCAHGYFYTLTELQLAKSIVINLSSVMTALVATESFTDDRLIKMTVINLYALNHIASGGGAKSESLTNDEESARSLILDLLAGALSAFLVPVHTLKVDENLLDYYALPAVKIIFHQIRECPSILTENVFMKRLQIWPSFCKLLNNIQEFLKNFEYENYSSIALYEDRYLKGFLPLSKYLKQFDFDKESEGLKIERLIRAHRLLEFGIWLTDHEVNGTKLMTKIEHNGLIKFEPGSIQPDPTNDLLEEIKSFSIESKCLGEIKKGAEKKTGILKPQGSLERAREEREMMSSVENNSSDSLISTCSNVNAKQETAKMKRAKQNVALQSIFKKMEENKQVKFSVDEKSKDKFVKFEQQKTTPTAKISNNLTSNVGNSVVNNTQPPFGTPVRTQSFNQNHPVLPSANASAPTSNHQQDYLTALRNMANGYGMPGTGGASASYPMQAMYGGMQQGGMPGGWGAQPSTAKPNYAPMNMGPATYNHLQSSGFDGNATANWWNSQGNNMMNTGAGYGGFNSSPFPGSMMGGAKVTGGNQASGDSFNSPWNYGSGMGAGYDQNVNMSMRQQMLKEANNVPANIQNQHNTSGYSLFNANSWNLSLPSPIRNPIGPSSENALGSLQQSSLFANQRPQSLAQLLEQQNQMHKNDFH